MELSLRLSAVAALVSQGSTVADIGTDHGYIPIFLVENKICPKAYAMDVRKGPLMRAQEHITGHGLGNYIETRLSDGLGALAPGEADCMIAAGMGGNLIIKILEEGHMVLTRMTECILQPQSEIAKVRCYLVEHGYESIAEDMVLEDRKYYPMMKVRKSPVPILPYQEAEYRYGRLLLQEKHPVLRSFLEWEIAGKKEIIKSLNQVPGESAGRRRAELMADLGVAEEAYGMMAE